MIVGSQGIETALACPNLFPFPGQCPFEGPEIMIAEKVIKVPDFQKFINGFFDLRPAVADIAQGNEPVVLVIKMRALQAVLERFIRAVNIADDKCFHSTSF